MAKFCTKCGRPLAEGEVCSCRMQNTSGAQQYAQGAMGANQPAQGYQHPGVGAQGYPNPQQVQQQYQQGYQQNPYQKGPFQQGMQGAGGQPYNTQQQYEYQQQVQQAQQQYQQMQNAASNLFSKAIGTFISVLKSPVETGKKLIAFADWGVLIILIAFQALMAGCYDLAVMAKISSISAYIKMPYAKSFFAVVLASAALAFILAAMLLAGNLIAKNAVSFQQMLACVAVRSVLLTITTAISIVIFALFPIGGTFLYYASCLWGTVTMVMIMPKNTPGGKEDWLALTQFIVYFLFMIVFFLFALVCSKAFVPSASGLGGLESIFNALDYYF